MRWCVDAEAQNVSLLDGASDNENALMDRIIRAKIGDALRWVSLFGPAELLNGSDTKGTETGMLVDVAFNSPSVDAESGVELKNDLRCWRLVMPENFIKVSRVRVNGWHKAVCTPIEEDSEEALMLYDANGATATIERPQAVIVNKAKREIELWPKPDVPALVEATIVVEPSAIDEMESGLDTTVAIPPKTKTAFLYYIAYLLLSAYGDARSERMLSIAKENLLAK